MIHRGPPGCERQLFHGNSLSSSSLLKMCFLSRKVLNVFFLKENKRKGIFDHSCSVIQLKQTSKQVTAQQAELCLWDIWRRGIHFQPWGDISILWTFLEMVVGDFGVRTAVAEGTVRCLVLSMPSASGFCAGDRVTEVETWVPRRTVSRWACWVVGSDWEKAQTQVLGTGRALCGCVVLKLEETVRAFSKASIPSFIIVPLFVVSDNCLPFGNCLPHIIVPAESLQLPARL